MIAMSATVLYRGPDRPGLGRRRRGRRPRGHEVPPGVVVAGVPAKVRRETTDEDRARLDHAWKTYAALIGLHKSGTIPSPMRGTETDKH